MTARRRITIPSGRIYYSASMMICTPASLAQEVGAALGAQAGEERIRKVATAAGFTRFRRAAETPFNLVFKAVHERRESLAPECYCSFANSALACFRMGMSGSASFIVDCGLAAPRTFFWHSFAADSNLLNSGVPRSFTSSGSVCKVS